ncbi:MAG: diaminopimelate decarboxylase, partial [Planctomycetota bacterium]|nr:diaminopimelate decarboxylase [Planctomycetota bacterium]
LKANKLHCNAGSPDMISQLGEIQPQADLTLRINPGFGHGHSQKTNTGGDSSKHGIWHEQIDECIERARAASVTISGLHMHIGSGTDFEHLAQVCNALQRTALKVGPTLKTISAGGGLPTPYKASDQMIDLDQYFELWDAVRNQLAAEFGHPISLEIEPGRYLSAESGYLITEIRAIKTMGEKLYYLVDAGFNNLARPIMYGAYHPISVATQNDPVQAIVGGPLCESGDIFTQEEGGFVSQRKLPAANVGDYLIIECAGAYGFVMSSNYNSKPFAAEVLLHNNQAHLIRERQSNEDLTRGEHIPVW